MRLHLLMLAFICAAASANAQPKEPTIFRPFYFHFGVNLPSANTAPPAPANSIKQNILNGNYGARNGYLFELGTRIYFNNDEHRLRYGLNWTFLSASYNRMDWTSFIATKGGSTGDAFTLGLSSKLGPVMSYHIAGKLVADVHFQLAPTLQYSTFYYLPANYGSGENFSFNADNVSDIFGVKTSTGIGVRWGVIGLSADYMKGKVNSSFIYSNTATGEGGTGTPAAQKQRLPFSSLQLSFTLNL